MVLLGRTFVAGVAAALLLSGCGSQQSPIDPSRFGTWLWNGNAWKQLAHSKESPPTSGYGYTDGESLLYWPKYGGLLDSDGTRWDGTSWVTTANKIPEPPAGTNLPNDARDQSLQRTATVLDEADDELLYVDPNTETMSTWTGTSWKPVVSPSEWPKARFIYGVTYDPLGGRVVMVLCCDPYESGMETWEWKSGKLSELDLLPEKTTFSFELTPDGSGRIIAFGLHEGYILDGGRWLLRGNAGLPAPQYDVLYDSGDGEVIAITFDLGVLVWRPDTGRWDAASSGTVPPDSCAVSNPVYDPELGGVVLTTLAGRCVAMGLP